MIIKEKALDMFTLLAMDLDRKAFHSLSYFD